MRHVQDAFLTAANIWMSVERPDTSKVRLCVASSALSFHQQRKPARALHIPQETLYKAGVFEINAKREHNWISVCDNITYEGFLVDLGNKNKM